MAKKPAAKPDDQPEQKIQLVTPDFKPPRTASDDDRELYRRIVEDAKARGVEPDLSPLFPAPEAAPRAPYVPKHYNVDAARVPKAAATKSSPELEESRGHQDDFGRAIPRLMTVLRITRQRRGLANAPFVAVKPRSATEYQVTYGSAERVVSGDAAISFLADLIAREGVLEKILPLPGGDVVHTPLTDIMNTEDFAKQFAEVAPYLNEKQLAAVLEKARHDARIGRFLAEINASDNKPIFKRDAPASLKMPDYLEREWFAKGWLRPDVDLQMVEAYEPGLPHLISTWERRNGILPEHLRFKKILNRTSEAERQARNDKSVARLG